MIKYIDIQLGIYQLHCTVNITDPERESGVVKIPKTIEVVSSRYLGWDITKLLDGLNDLIGNNLLWNKIDELIADQL